MYSNLIRVLILGGVFVMTPELVTGADLPQTATGKDGAPLRLIPGGEFLMGTSLSTRDGARDEYPERRIFLNAFYMDVFEVTNGRYLAFTKAAGHRTPEHPRDKNLTLWRGATVPDAFKDHPVVNVAWSDAAAYCAWAGRRLPTEAEWERAARGTTGRRFPWGDMEPTRTLANYLNQWRNGAGLEPVGSHPQGASAEGVQDLQGNVWEWVADWYDPSYYATGPSRNPKGPDEGTRKVIRGSGWESEAPLLRSAHRLSSDPANRNHSLGFRCAMDAVSITAR
jgi:formylglycine-generating enzyme required for sulfatase activity